ncbi:unnamed protein product, partial [Cylicocyclus nassatus]
MIRIVDPDTGELKYRLEKWQGLFVDSNDSDQFRIPCEIWSNGNICLSDVSWSTCAYTARYVTKKVSADYDGKDFNPNKLGIQPEFALMSRRPGIAGFYHLEHPDYYRSMSVFVDNGKDVPGSDGIKRVRIPHYVFDHLSDSDPALFQRLKEERRKFGSDKDLLELSDTDLDLIWYNNLKQLRAPVKQHKDKKVFTRTASSVKSVNLGTTAYRGGSAVSDPAFFVSNPGDRFAPVYSSAVRADGTISVVQSDSIDLQAKYNSLRSTTDMSYILARLKLGDQSVLNVKHGTFGDFSAMPTNMAEYLQLAIDGEMVFNRLPKDTRAKFDFDLNKWLSSIGTDSWIESMSAFLPGLEKSFGGYLVESEEAANARDPVLGTQSGIFGSDPDYLLYGEHTPAPPLTPPPTPGGGGGYSPPARPSSPKFTYLNADLAKAYKMNKNVAYQEALANTAHQREMADLKAAGLNPVLTASGGAGASANVTPVESSQTSGSSGGRGSRKEANSGAGLISAIMSIGTGLAVGIGTGNPLAGISAGGDLIPCYHPHKMIRIVDPDTGELKYRLEKWQGLFVDSNDSDQFRIPCEIWSNGNICLSDVSWSTCAYTARYVTKKVSADYDGKDFNPNKLGIQPEFALMSRRPGIAGFYHLEHPDYYRSMSVFVDNGKDVPGSDGIKRVRIPHYVFDHLSDSDPALFQRLKEERRKFGSDKDLLELSDTDLDLIWYNNLKQLRAPVKQHKDKKVFTRTASSVKSVNLGTTAYRGGSAVSDPAFFVSNPGDRFAPVYSSAVRADGTISVVQSDSIDLQAKYNSLRSTTDMSYILARLKLGDQSVLNVKHGTFGDFSAMPTNMAEYLQLAIDGEMVFNRLPKDTRAKFDFDFNKWLSSIGTDSWIESMSAFLPGLEKSFGGYLVESEEAANARDPVLGTQSGIFGSDPDYLLYGEHTPAPPLTPPPTPGGGGGYSPPARPSSPKFTYLNADLAKAYKMNKNVAYQEALANTAHQREMADLKAAGLNPVLTASGGAGASANVTPVESSQTSGSSGGRGSRKEANSGAGLISAIMSIGTGLAVGIGTGNPLAGISAGGDLIPCYHPHKMIRIVDPDTGELKYRLEKWQGLFVDSNDSDQFRIPCEIWSNGNICLSDVSWSTCAYTARYVTKKVSADYDGKDFNPNKLGIQPEFALMSRRPGIAGFYHLEHPDYYRSMSVFVDNGKDVPGSDGIKRVRIPHYVFDHLSDSDPALFQRLKEERRKFGSDKDLLELSDTDLDLIWYNNLKQLRAPVKQHKDKKVFTRTASSVKSVNLGTTAYRGGSAVSDPAFFVSNPGDRFAPVYSSAVRADGTISVVQSDSIDLQAKYNSLRSTTDMSYILARLKLGDQSVLNVKHGTFGDFSAMPTNMAEYLQLAIDGEMVFNRLPKDTRAKFDFDLNKWLSSIGTDSWIESMSAFLPGLEKSFGGYLVESEEAANARDPVLGTQSGIFGSDPDYLLYGEHTPAPPLTPPPTPGGGGGYSPPARPSSPKFTYLNADLAKAYKMNKNVAYQEALANTAHQREMADLKAAGLNPVLTASGGAGASANVTPVESSQTSGSSGGRGSRKEANSGAGLISAIMSIGTGLAVGIGTGNPLAGISAGGDLIPCYHPHKMIRIVDPDTGELKYRLEKWQGLFVDSNDSDQFRIPCEIWSNGNICLSDVSWSTCAYTARYVTKKVSADYDGKDFNPNKLGIQPEFALMSRRPGIAGFYHLEHPDYYRSMSVFVDNGKDVPGSDGIKRVRIPHYVFDHLSDSDPALFQRLKEERRKFGSDKDLLELSDTDLDLIWYNNLKQLRAPVKQHKDKKVFTRTASSVKSVNLGTTAYRG